MYIKPTVNGSVVEPLEVVGAVTVLFSVFTQVMVWAAAEESRMRTTDIWPSVAEVVVIVMVRVAAELLVTVFSLCVIGTVAAFPDAVMALFVQMMFPAMVMSAVEAPIAIVVAAPAKLTVVAVALTREKVVEGVVRLVVMSGEVIDWTPVKVCPASVRAMVALVLGKVIVVESVPSRVRDLLTIRVLPSAMVRVAEVAGAVIATLLMEVAVATPRTGVVRVGLVAKTRRPDPVSSVTAAARLALEGVARKVATFAPRPETPVEMGRPVQLVRVPEAGVPRTGATRVSAVPSVVAPVMPPKAPALLYWTWVFEPPGEAEAVAHERTPEPSVWRNWEGVPSSTGRVRV